MKVWHLQIDSFASRMSEIPYLAGELTRRPRVEYILDLQRENVLDGFSTQHRRNISRASKAGSTIRRPASNPPAPSIANSWMLRWSAGPIAAKRSLVWRCTAAALLASRSGEIFQAVDGDRVLSSVLVLKSRQGAYYQSAGTLPDGMKLGASPFLIAQVAVSLRRKACGFSTLAALARKVPDYKDSRLDLTPDRLRFRRPHSVPRRCRGAKISCCPPFLLALDKAKVIWRDFEAKF